MNQKQFDEIVRKSKQSLDKYGNHLNIHYLLYRDNEKVLSHQYKENRTPSDIRSISKTIMTIFTGVIIKLSEEGKYPKLDENAYVFPVIRDRVNLTNLDNLDKLEKIQVKHLLTHTIGYEDSLLMRDDIKDRDPFTYLDYIINYPIIHSPGEYYLYSNAGFYMLSAFLQEFLQEDLLDVMERELFSHLGIKDVKWDKYGNYLAGATRLWLFPEDLLAVGELLMNKGLVDGKQLFNPQWLTKMTKLSNRTKEIDDPNMTFRRYGYGLGIWLAGDDSFYFGHGTDGQILCVLPEEEVVIVVLSSQKDIKPVEKMVDEIINLI